ncbi:acetyl-coenzyme A synthetase [Coxiella burnetii CbuG_Q212]|nr:acetyl-coenzyme A synthetase [Coxiella burnetii CbuG_Q212]
MPKTRSGKIMRRILRRIVNGETEIWGIFPRWQIQRPFKI